MRFGLISWVLAVVMVSGVEGTGGLAFRRFDASADSLLTRIAVKRDLGALQRRQQFGFVAMETSTSEMETDIAVVRGGFMDHRCLYGQQRGGFFGSSHSPCDSGYGVVQ